MDNVVINITETIEEVIIHIEDGYDDVKITITEGGGGPSEWGLITGTLSDQTDLQTELDNKSNKGKIEWDCELGENLNAGDPVYVYDDVGQKIKKCFSQAESSEVFGRGYYNAMAKLDANKYILAYRDIGSSSYGYVRVCQFDANNNITMGTPLLFYAGATYYIDICHIDTDKFIVVYKGAGNFGYAVVGTVTGVEINPLGTPVAFNSAYVYYNSCCKLDTDKFVVCYKDAGTSSYGVARVGAITGNVITFGTAVTYSPGVTSYINCCTMGANDKFAVGYYVSSSGRACVGSVAGNIITFGAESIFNDAPVYSAYIQELAPDKIGVVYRDGGDGQRPNMRVAEVAGVEIGIWGSEYTFLESNSYYHAIARLEDNKFVLVFTRDIAPYSANIIKCEVVGTDINPISSEQCFSDERTYYVDILAFGADKYAFVWYDAGSDATGKTLVVEGDINTIPFCIGLLSEDGLLGETKTIDMISSITETLSGLTPGWAYFIQCDGSISEMFSSFLIGIAIESSKLFISKTVV